MCLTWDWYVIHKLSTHDHIDHKLSTRDIWPKLKACLTRDQYNWQVIHTWLTRLTCDTWLKLPPDQHVTDMWLTRSCNQHVWHVTVWPGHDWHVTKWHTTDMTRDWHDALWHMNDATDTWSTHDQHDTWVIKTIYKWSSRDQVWHMTDTLLTRPTCDRWFTWLAQSTHDRVWHVSEARPVLHWHMIDTRLTRLARDHHTWLARVQHDSHVIDIWSPNHVIDTDVTNMMQ